MLEAQAVEEAVEGVGAQEVADVRPLPERRRAAELEVGRNEVTTAALAAAGGVVAGAATVAVVRAIGALSHARRGPRLPLRRGRPKVVASRSFLVDVHVLGK